MLVSSLNYVSITTLSKKDLGIVKKTTNPKVLFWLLPMYWKNCYLYKQVQF